jgi:hypothetical protein
MPEVQLSASDAMQLAFRKLCLALRIDGDLNDPKTDLLLARIVAFAKGGDFDPDSLCSKVLTSMGGSRFVDNKAPVPKSPMTTSRPVLRPKAIGIKRRHM